MAPVEGPHPVDTYVGTRIKVRRKLLKMTQTDLANALGVSYQQVQKYEKGDNRVSASMLHATAKILGVQLVYFFEGAPDVGMLSAPVPQAKGNSKPDPMVKPDVIRLIREFDRIVDPKVRRRLIDLAVSFAESENRRDA